MEANSPYRPRVSRETRLLLTAGLVAVAALWLLARIRFPERPVDPNPVPSVLSQLASVPKFDGLAGEIAQHQESLEGRVRAAGACYSSRVVIGKPADCLLALAAEIDPGLVVVGSPRPRGISGLRSRMQMETLVKGLKAPLLVVPYPR